jgi:hypothetical protein
VPEGVYSGDYTVPVGVTLRPATGARVAIDVTDAFTMTGATVRDIEIMSSGTDIFDVQTGIVMGLNSRLIGCTVHNLRSNGVIWFSSGAGEIIDCVFYANGYKEEDSSNHGHCIYSHNHGGGDRIIDNNILFGGRGKYALHVYSGGSNNLKDYKVTRNVSTFRPMIVGGGLGVSGLLYEANIQYGNACYIGRYSSDNIDCEVTDNLYLGEAFLEITDFDTVIESGNVHVSDAQAVTTACAQATRKLAHVAVLNPESDASVQVDFTALALAGGEYVLRNAQHYSEGYRFDYDGTPLTLPMIGWKAGGAGKETTSPMFGAFILERTS